MADDKSPSVIRRTGSVFSGGKVPTIRDGYNPWENNPIMEQGRKAREIRGNLTEKEKKEKEKKEKEKKRASQARRTSSAQQIYVNGRLSTIYTLIDPETGEPVQVETLGGYRKDGKNDPVLEGSIAGALSPGQRREYDARNREREATFSLLNMPAETGDLRFIMSTGMQLDEDGKGWYDNPRGQEITEQRMMRGREPYSPSRTNATNMMTLAGGVTAFRALARRDPDAFNEILDLLVKAKYLPADAARKGVYTIDAGNAFAKAALEASENVTAESKDDFVSFLHKVAGAAADAEDEQKKAAFQPVDRQYTDPTYLAATARSAAEELLGRGLTDEELARFNSRFRGLEDAKYNQIDAAGRAETAAKVTDPNALGQADAYVRGPQFEEDRTRWQTGNYIDSFLDMINGG